MAEGKDAPESLALGESSEGAAGIPMRFLTRHGIIAGSTGTGKSRAMQVLAEQLADSGVHVFVSDVKGDASGFCVSGAESARNRTAPFAPHAIEANYWSVSGRFIPLRFSVSQAGSILLSKLLSLNPTQESHLAIAFSYAKKAGRGVDTPAQLLDLLDDLVQSRQRGISASSISVIQRKIIALQESGLDRMFGKQAVRLGDLGGLNVLNLSDARQNMGVAIAPAFLLQKLFARLPEVGEVERPRFVIFFDEAHYLFKDANKSLRDLMATILRQIRSKGVSVFFVTQDVTDIPDEVLGQLSTKIIFSQKVMTEKGNARLRALSKSFPKCGFDVMEKLKAMPPGTALLSTLDEEGNQTAPEEVRVFAPATTMSVVPDEELRMATDRKLLEKYSRAAAPARKKPPKKPAAPPRQPEPAAAEPAPPPLRAPPPKARAAPGKSGPSALDGILGALLKLLRFLLRAGGMVFDALLMKPLRAFFKYLAKKPVRVLYFLLLLLLIYAIAVNWGVVAGLLGMLKLS